MLCADDEVDLKDAKTDALPKRLQELNALHTQSAHSGSKVSIP